MTTNRTEPDLRNRSEHVLLRKLRRLDLDAKDFVIFGSAPLLVHGLRTDIRDLDVLARNDVWKEVEAKGTLTFGRVTGDELRGFSGGRIQFSQHWISVDYDTDALIDNAKIVGGLPFAQLEDVLRYKEELDRDKDQADIRALHKRLGNHVPAGCRR